MDSARIDVDAIVVGWMRETGDVVTYRELQQLENKLGWKQAEKLVRFIEPSEMSKQVDDMADALLGGSEVARRAFEALKHRGASAESAKRTIGHAWLGCVSEVRRGAPDRLAEVLRLIVDGAAIGDFFPQFAAVQS